MNHEAACNQGGGRVGWRSGTEYDLHFLIWSFLYMFADEAL